MAGFAVFGMTEHQVQRLARKRVNPKWFPKEKRYETEMEFESRVTQKTEEILATGRPTQLSPAYDAPQYCRLFMGLAERAGRVSNLEIRHREKVLVGAGEGKSGRIRQVWSPFYGE